MQLSNTVGHFKPDALLQNLSQPVTTPSHNTVHRVTSGPKLTMRHDIKNTNITDECKEKGKQEIT